MRMQLFVALGTAAILAGLIIGLANSTYEDGQNKYSDIRCGSAWGGHTTGSKQDSPLSTCAQIRSDRFTWSVTLTLAGIGLLGCAPFARQPR